MNDIGLIAALAKALGGGGGGSSPSSAPLIVNSDLATGALDKTWKEIHDAFVAGTTVINRYYDEDSGNEVNALVYQVSTQILGSDPAVYVVMDAAFNEFIADSENGYPVINQG